MLINGKYVHSKFLLVIFNTNAVLLSS